MIHLYSTLILYLFGLALPCTGKSTLLDLLAMRPSGNGLASGRVCVNGQLRNPSFLRASAYVPQVGGQRVCTLRLEGAGRGSAAMGFRWVYTSQKAHLLRGLAHTCLSCVELANDGRAWCDDWRGRVECSRACAYPAS